jgi:hypothetical protein
MENITIHRYSEKESEQYAGCIQPVDHSWILYVRRDGGKPELHERDPKTGAIHGQKPAVTT